MSRKVCLATIAVGIVLSTAVSVVRAQQEPAQRPVTVDSTPQSIVQLKPGLYMVAGAGANTAVRVTNDGIVVVGTKQIGDMYYEELIRVIRTVSDKPIKYAVVENVHQDKSGNTKRFVDAGVQVVAQVNVKTGLATYVNNRKTGTPGPPNVTFDKEYSIRLGNSEVAHIYYYGPASTGGDSVTYFPDLKVAVMGGIFTEGVDYAQNASIIGWQKAVESVLKLDIDIAIPNRGNPATKADLRAFHDRLTKINATAIDLMKKGTPKDQIVAKINAVDPKLQADILLRGETAELTKMRLDSFYEEISAAAKGSS